jgi:hypothetical protein
MPNKNEPNDSDEIITMSTFEDPAQVLRLGSKTTALIAFVPNPIL